MSRKAVLRKRGASLNNSQHFFREHPRRRHAQATQIPESQDSFFTQPRLFLSDVQRCNSARKVPIADLCETRCAHGLGQRFLVRKPGDGVRKVLVRPAHAGNPSPQSRQHLPEVEAKQRAKERPADPRKLYKTEHSSRPETAMQARKP